VSASVHRGVLSVTDEAAGTSVVVARGLYQRVLGSAIGEPSFSRDGRFVAYLEAAGSSTELHVVSVDGGEVTAVDGVRSYAWSPVGDDLALSLPRVVELVLADGTSLRRWVVMDPGRAMFSPSGRSIAVGSQGGGSGRGYLRLLPVSATLEGSISQPGCDIPAGWTADGSHVLFWRDEECSASIAADGLPLDSIAIKKLDASSPGGAVSAIVNLGSTLPYPGWLVPVSGDTVLVNSGGDRVAADHKTLRTCNATTGACRSLPLPAGVATLDPSVAKLVKQLFEVRVAQSSAMDDFVPLGTLWRAKITGGRADELSTAGAGVADPVPIADDSMVIFVRMTSVRAARVEVLTVRTGALRTIATVDLDDYYGEFMASTVLAIWQPPT
jgi:hypothetical protein